MVGLPDNQQEAQLVLGEPTVRWYFWDFFLIFGRLSIY